MSEDDTTSSSRIFVKIIMQKVMESMSLFTLQEGFGDHKIKALCTSMFSSDNPNKMRFSIHYFTSTGLGALTEEMRDLKVNRPSNDLSCTRPDVLFPRT